MKRISVIIPMYNVEEYVERCIRSLENQDIPQGDYEIICINDGSPDNCGKVVERLQNEYPNIILIDQENMGVSRARNVGIEAASGEYLLFIDPDDYIDTNVFADTLGYIDFYNAQVAFLGYTVLNEDGTERIRFFNQEHRETVFPGYEAYFKARGDGKTDPDRMVAVFFSRELIASYHLRYLPDVPYLEDGEFIARILCMADRCVFSGRSFYQRTTRPGSATHSNLVSSERASRGFLLAACNLKKFQNENLLTTPQYNLMNQAICKFTILYVDPARDRRILLKVRYLKKILHTNGFDKLDLSGVDNEFTSLGSLYNKSLVFFMLSRYVRLFGNYLK